MNRDTTHIESDESRRSILKKGALSVGALTVGGVGTAAAQEDDGGFFDDDDDGEIFDDQWRKALMYVGQARPGKRFVITSPVIDWTPDIGEIQDNIWSNYNTRTMRYLNSDEQHLFWVAHEAEIPEYDDEAGYVVDPEGDTGPNNSPQPEVYSMHSEWTPLGGDAAYITLNFTPVGEDEEDTLLETEDWWRDDDDEVDVGGNATNTTNATNATGNLTE